MPDEIGLEVEEAVEVFDPMDPPIVPDDDSPDESDASPTDTPAVSERASELAKKLNVETLPADPEEVYALASKRLDEMRDFGRKTGEDRKAEIESLRAEMAQMKAMMAPPAPKRNGPPVGASDEEILNWYTDRRLEEKLKPILSLQEQQAAYVATQMVEAARARYSDFEKNEDAITAALQRFPSMTLDEAYAFVTAPTAKERAKEELRAEIEVKKNASGTLKSGGVSGTSLKEPENVRDVEERSFWDFAYKAAKREHGIE